MSKRELNKSSLIKLLIALIASAIVIVCIIGVVISKSAIEGKIKIVSSSWSGWSEDYKPEETVTYCEIELNKKCVVSIGKYHNADGDEWEEEKFSFEITHIEKDSITIHTFQNFSNEENGIDLRSKKRDFVISTDKPLELTTPTMDAGDIYILTLH